MRNDVFFPAVRAGCALVITAVSGCPLVDASSVASALALCRVQLDGRSYVLERASS
jgi:hypothetical protein